MAKKIYEKTSVTKATWNDRLKAWDGSVREVSRGAQSLLLFGFDEAEKSGNFDKLFSVYRRASRHGLNKKQMLGFITSVANCKIVNEGKKNAKFVKASKKKPPITGEVKGWWFDFEYDKKDVAKQPSDLVKLVTQFENSLNRKLEAHAYVEGQEPAVEAFIEYMKRFDFDAERHIAPELKVVKG